MKRAATVALLGALLLQAVPAGAAEESLPEYDGPGFVSLYDYAVANTLPNLAYPESQPRVTGDAELDDRIWARAFERGYRLRPVATGVLVNAGGARMQPEAADAWAALREEIRAAGLGFGVSSAYRSPDTQRSTFLSHLSGSSDSAIDAALTWWSIPGASKHHSGYALDFRYPNGTFGQFRGSPGYNWMVEDNFARPKRHGLIPSYPDDVADQGPNPEPWEFVWVGVDLVECGVPQGVPTVFGPAAAVVRDIGRCPGGQQPVQIPGWLVE